MELKRTLAEGVLAEGEGFEPSIRETRIPDFESGAFDHSAILPFSAGKKFLDYIKIYNQINCLIVMRGIIIIVLVLVGLKI